MNSYMIRKYLPEQLSIFGMGKIATTIPSSHLKIKNLKRTDAKVNKIMEQSNSTEHMLQYEYS